MKRVLMLSTVASLQDQFNMANIRMLRNLHCDVHVACNFVQGNNTSPQRIAVFQNELAALGVTCHQIDFARSPFHLLQNHRAYQQLKAVLRADTFDCILPYAGGRYLWTTGSCCLSDSGDLYRTWLSLLSGSTIVELVAVLPCGKVLCQKNRCVSHHQQ